MLKAILNEMKKNKQFLYLFVYLKVCGFLPNTFDSNRYGTNLFGNQKAYHCGCFPTYNKLSDPNYSK